MTSTTAHPVNERAPQTTWHTDLRRGALSNQTDVADRHRLEVPDASRTLRLGLQSNDGSVTACIQAPSTRQPDDTSWYTAKRATTDGKATWQPADPETGTWTVTVEAKPDAQEKPAEAQTCMEGQQTARQALYG